MLELKDVRFSVTDEKGQLKNIINGINLKIDEGKFVAITGPKVTISTSSKPTNLISFGILIFNS